MTFTAEHLYGLVLTLALVAAVGIGAARKVKNAADFTVGGHRSGTTLVAGTIIGTIIGGASTVGTAQLAFSVGLSAWWFTLGCGLALLALGLFYARPLRATGLETIPQYLAVNYGPAAGPITGLASSLGIFFSLVANILSAVPLISATLSFGPVQSALLVFALVVAYVFFGGVWGTGLVGVLKTILVFLTLAAVAWVSCQRMGGPGDFWQAFPAYPWLSIFGRGAWTDIGGALSLIVGTLSTQTYIQAVYAARDVATARRGAVLAALVTLPSGLPAVMAGLFMRAHHPDIASIEALPLFILYYLPPWFGGIALAALLLAAVGTAAGLALGVATMLSRDIIDLPAKWRGERSQLWLNRGVVLGISFAATVFTFGNLKSLVLDWNYLSMGLRGAGIFLPLSAAVFFPGRVRRREGVLSMVAGAGVALAWKGLFPAGIDPLYAGLAASGLALALGWNRGEKNTRRV